MPVPVTLAAQAASSKPASNATLWYSAMWACEWCVLITRDTQAPRTRTYMRISLFLFFVKVHCLAMPMPDAGAIVIVLVLLASCFLLIVTNSNSIKL